MESEPPYQYVGGNVVNLTDPSGQYGIRVHKKLTYDLVKELATQYGLGDIAEYLAEEISEGNQHVDEAVGILDAVKGCNRCHFQSYTDSKDRINAAIYDSGNPFLFGAALHLYQDYWSHWHEGYDTIQTYEGTIVIKGVPLHVKFEGYSHAMHYNTNNILNQFVSSAGYKGRSQATINEFFEKYPRDSVEIVVRYRNPGLSSVNDNELIDLYLRNEFDYMPGLFAMRSEYNFYTDEYIENSWRDKMMEFESRRAIKYYLGRIRNMCELPERPSDPEIRSFLLNGKAPLGLKIWGF